MKIEGSYTVPAPLDRVWKGLMSPETIARALPGCEQFEPDAAGGFRVVLKMGVAAIKGTYQGRVEITDVIPPVSYRMKIEGKGSGGFVEGDGSLSIAPFSGDTVITYSGEARLGGAIAAVGQRLAQVAARHVVSQFFRSFARIVSPSHGDAS